MGSQRFHLQLGPSLPAAPRAPLVGGSFIRQILAAAAHGQTPELQQQTQDASLGTLWISHPQGDARWRQVSVGQMTRCAVESRDHMGMR